MDNHVATVISQRLKLATADLGVGNTTLDDLLNRILSQNLTLTPEELNRQRNRVKQLYAQTKGQMEALQSANHYALARELNKMELSADRLADVTGYLSKTVLDTDIRHTIPAEIRRELEMISEQGAQCTLDPQRIPQLLSFCLVERSKQILASGKQYSPQKQTKEQQLAGVKAVQQLRNGDFLPDYLVHLSDERIAQLMNYKNAKNILSMSDHDRINCMMNALAGETLTDLAKSKLTQDLPAQEVSDGDLRARHMLAIASMLNMKATGKLPSQLDNCTEVRLAAMAYASTELNYYFDEAAASRVSMETFMEIAENLLVAALLLYVTADLLFGGGIIGIPVVIMALITSSFSLVAVAQAIAVLLADLYPAGIDETRLGIAVKAGVDKIRRFAADMIANLRGNEGSNPGFGGATAKCVMKAKNKDKVKDTNKEKDK